MLRTNYLPGEIEFNDLVMEWNKKINLVSRKKTDVFDLIDDSRIFLEYISHPGPFLKRGNYGGGNQLKILDLGTGGGFPGIVVKIHRPEVRVVLVDSIMKKITAVCDIITRLNLEGISAVCSRAEDLSKNNVFKHTFDYVVSRSVAPLQDLVKWSRGLIKPDGRLLTLKGKNIGNEIKATQKLKYIKEVEISDREDKIFIQIKYYP